MNNYNIFADYIKNFVLPKDRTIKEIYYKRDYTIIFLDNGDSYYDYKKKTIHPLMDEFNKSDFNKNNKIKRGVFDNETMYVLTMDMKVFVKINGINEFDLIHNNIKDIEVCDDQIYMLTINNTVIKYDSSFDHLLNIYISNINQISASCSKVLFRDNNNDVYLRENDMNKKLELPFKVIDIYIRDDAQIYLLSDKNEVYTNILNVIFPKDIFSADLHEANTKFIKIAENIDALSRVDIHEQWNSNDHIKYPIKFKKSINVFILCLKRNQTKTGLRIPKFVIFEIIKRAA